MTSLARPFVWGLPAALIVAAAALGPERVHAPTLPTRAAVAIGDASYALYLVLSKPDMKRLTPQRVIARMFAIGAVLMLPIAARSLWTEKWASIPGTAWLALLFVIGGATVAAYLLNAWALAHTDSSLVAMYIYPQPALTIILAAIFLGETIQPVVIAATAVIFAGVYLAGRPPSRRRPPGGGAGGVRTRRR